MQIYPIVSYFLNGFQLSPILNYSSLNVQQRTRHWRTHIFSGYIEYIRNRVKILCGKHDRLLSHHPLISIYLLVSHESHGSHNSHGSHSSHESYGSHGFHGCHESHGSHKSRPPLKKKKFLVGGFNDFLNNIWFGFTVVYGCFYYIVNAHYKG